VTAYESERDEFQEMLEEDKEKIQREKDQLLVEKTAVKEVVAYHFALCQAWHRKNMNQLRFKW
jgi:hypothetical protein